MNIYTFHVSDGIFQMVGRDVLSALRSLRYFCNFTSAILLNVRPLEAPLSEEYDD